MNKKEHINYWIESAEHDLETAETLFQSDKYDWCLFIGHLVLEKILKAAFVETNDNVIPPKIHNLVKLATLSNMTLSETQMIFLNKVNGFNLEIRYPEYKQEFYQWQKSQIK